eukprot:485424-Rhodomonas_salina.2
MHYWTRPAAKSSASNGTPVPVSGAVGHGPSPLSPRQSTLSTCRIKSPLVAPYAHISTSQTSATRSSTSSDRVPIMRVTAQSNAIHRVSGTDCTVAVASDCSEAYSERALT